MAYELFSYYYDSLMDQSFYKDYYSFINEVATFESVLELACGTGEIAIRLTKDQKEVYATDLSKDILEVAKIKAMQADVTLMLARIDMTDFQVDRQVDLVLCLCDSINYILDKENVSKTFKNAYLATKEQGTFIFDVNSIFKMENTLLNYHEKEDDNEFYFEWKVSKLGYGEIKHDIWIHDKIEKEKIYEEHFQKTLEVKEYMEMLHNVGFKQIELFSDFKEYKENGERVIFVCRKEG